jgi:hypothetical protein
MRRICSVIGLAAICLGNAVSVAQTQPASETDVSVAQIFFEVPKPGRSDEYERGVKRHIAWHKANHDKWTWHAWQVVTGKDTGDYIVGTFGHRWEDFDAREEFTAAVSSDFNRNVGPFLSLVSCTFYVLRTDLSLSPEPEAQPKYLQLNIFAVRPEGAREFSQSIRKMNVALKKTNFVSESFLSPNSAGGHSRWYFMTNGGEGPQYVLVTERNSYRDFRPVETSLDEVMEQVYGKEQGDVIMSNVRKTFTHVYSELLRYRPDLSYNP